MLPHINGHLAKGEVQAVQEWMNSQNKSHCRVCGLCVATSRGVHPTCRPLERATLARNHTGDPDDAGEADDDRQGGAAALPPLAEVMSRQTPILKHIPKACRHAWAQALTRALAKVGAQNTMEA